jgi:SAM-dependent methyltransferase
LQWDINSWSKALFYWKKNVEWDEINIALELGGHQGGLSLWLAGLGKKVVCSDLQNVKSTAEQLHVKHMVTDFVVYKDIDATKIPYENQFDLIVFKSIIGGIGRNDNYEIQKTVFKEIHKALKPGGILLFAENLIASPIHQYIRKRFVPWGSSWRYLSLKELEEVLHDFSSVKLLTSGVLGTFGRTESQRSFLSSIDDLALNHICPKSWKYIGYGMAQK